jgi:cytoskeleton protein RodZ
MALFTRKTPGSAASAEEAGRIESERRPKTIGELLGDARRHHGASIQAVGAALRIRPVFLQAIEDNRYDRLPGSVYALGFVRTYADYLGLDGEAFARRFKTEVAGLETKQDFSFPMPLPDRGLPGGALLLVALIVAACAYAVWYYRASGERTRPERVAAVPEQLIPLPPAALTPAPAPEQAAHPAPNEPASPEPTGTPTAAVPPPPSAPSTTVTASSNSPQTPPTETSTPRAPAVAEPAPPPQTAVSTLPPVSGETTTASPPAIPEVPAAPAVPPAPVPRVYGITNGPVRIVVKAAADSWVQVRDANQSVLQMRVLKSGDTLRVPDRAGLTLRTGNAGGLEITVDGKPVPTVGPFGKTRTVALDPERLVAGTSQVE